MMQGVVANGTAGLGSTSIPTHLHFIQCYFSFPCSFLCGNARGIIYVVTLNSSSLVTPASLGCFCSGIFPVILQNFVSFLLCPSSSPFYPLKGSQLPFLQGSLV